MKKKIAVMIILIIALLYITGCIQNTEEHSHDDDHSHESSGHSHHHFSDVLEEYGDFIFAVAYLQSHMDHLHADEIVEYLEDMLEYLKEEEATAETTLEIIKEDYSIDIENAILLVAANLDEDNIKAVSNSVYTIGYDFLQEQIMLVMRPQIAITLYNIYSEQEMYSDFESNIKVATLTNGFIQENGELFVKEGMKADSTVLITDPKKTNEFADVSAILEMKIEN